MPKHRNATQNSADVTLTWRANVTPGHDNLSPFKLHKHFYKKTKKTKKKKKKKNNKKKKQKQKQTNKQTKNHMGKAGRGSSVGCASASYADGLVEIGHEIA